MKAGIAVFSLRVDQTDSLYTQVPRGERLVFGDEQFVRFEEAGVAQIQDSIFVLVAGGLGERLGYSGIKVSTQLKL